MKNSMNFISAFGIVLFLGTGFCSAQVAGAVNRAKSTGEAASQSVVSVTGYAVPDRDRVSVQRNTTLAFAGESKTSEVKINTSEEYNFLKIIINSNFRSGTVRVELIDPKGENRGKYNLKTDDLVVTGDKTDVQELVVGNMEKEFNNPINGEWIVRAIPASASGTIIVRIIQEYRPVQMRYEIVEDMPTFQSEAKQKKDK